MGPVGEAVAQRAGQGDGRLLQRGAAPPHHPRSPLAHRGICAHRRRPRSRSRAGRRSSCGSRRCSRPRCCTRVQNITEHTGVTHEPDTVHNTRTISTWPLLRWMGCNMQYHSAHHTYPRCPSIDCPSCTRSSRTVSDTPRPPSVTSSSSAASSRRSPADPNRWRESAKPVRRTEAPREARGAARVSLPPGPNRRDWPERRRIESAARPARGRDRARREATP